ncbi:MAG: hypothetical protein HON90_04520 [Halobacteriovoraceae bacterium]|nr:hypothetical protein [Halobacteriovoraceae bacterium]
MRELGSIYMPIMLLAALLCGWGQTAIAGNLTGGALSSSKRVLIDSNTIKSTDSDTQLIDGTYDVTNTNANRVVLATDGRVSGEILDEAQRIGVDQVCIGADCRVFRGGGVRGACVATDMSTATVISNGAPDVYANTAECPVNQFAYKIQLWGAMSNRFRLNWSDLETQAGWEHVLTSVSVRIYCCSFN